MYTSLPVDSKSTIEQPKLGLMLIAANTWKNCCDHTFKNHHLGSVDEINNMTRFVVKTEIGKMLYLQHRIRHYNYVNSKYLSKDDIHENLNRLLLELKNSVADNGSMWAERKAYTTCSRMIMISRLDEVGYPREHDCGCQRCIAMISNTLIRITYFRRLLLTRF